MLTPTTRPTPVGESAAGVAGVQRGIGLDDVLDDSGCRPGPHGKRPIQRADHARGHRAHQAHRAADGDHELADPQLLGVTELGGGEPVAPHPDQAEVGETVGPGHVEGQLATVAQRRDTGPGLAQHVSRREHEAVGGDDDAGAGAACVRPPPATVTHDAKLDDRGQEPLGHGRDDARVRVERFGVGGDGIGRGAIEVELVGCHSDYKITEGPKIPHLTPM